MTTEAQVLRLAIAAYDAATSHATWTAFLASYAHATRANIALIQRHYLTDHRSQLLSTFGMTARFSESYNAHYSRMNVWREHGQRFYVPGHVIHDAQLYPRDLLHRTEFYNDYLLANHGTKCVAGIVSRSRMASVNLVALRDQPHADFDRDETELTECLLPHVMRAWTVGERFETLDAGTAALQTLTVGVLLLADDRRVIFSNAAASAIIASTDGLKLTEGRLAATSATLDAVVQALVRSALTRRLSIECQSALVKRQPPRCPLHLTAAPLTHAPAWCAGLPRPVVLLLIKDPERDRPVGLAALIHAFGLTRREAALASILAEGESLQCAAERLRMRYETARTHLRRIFSKTDSSRQADLVLLLARLSVS